MTIEISATKRQVQGTGASRRLRKANRVPGVVYGSGDAIMIELDHNTTYFALKNEAFHASVLSLDLDGKKESVLLRDFQMHPFRQQVQHVDFQRVDAKKKVHMKVPLHFVNAEIAPGVKLGGGIITHVLNELDVVCLAKDLPTSIEIDLAGLELGHSIHISDVKLPKGVEVATHHHAADAVATVQVPRGAVEAAATAAEGEAAPAAAPAAEAKK
ncbi:MAG: 50S ribosomal protein L25/general stress protein Ctc [Gammaproteobacteria bacterium]|nr:50S ribosomal protein L25/general stress protein Ctc [Gammaproteobacteria bacterium]MBU1448153.1 50S ribosomal protein L25/general stress protein Ctc [Gammaproteobacteria bacterium]MDD2929546.1 50S ribosomal protein L25/general stress protein Ctc [Sideroxydans sp.]MDD5470616.1 50S ribosomal protein L25/general stress protein Ctc [Sideroxydans sp.]